MVVAKQVAERLLNKLMDNASARKKDVARGLEKPELAGLLIQKYGYGLVDGFGETFPEYAGVLLTYSDVDRVVEIIDPDWKATQSARWSACAGLDLSTPRNIKD